MKQLLLVLSILCTPLIITAQPPDYTFGIKFPDTPQDVCDGNTANIAILLTDDGANGQNTFYEFFSPDGISLTGTTSGQVTNGFPAIIGCTVAPNGFAPGTYNIFVQASYDAGFCCDVILESFTINIIAPPSASISTPVGDLICDGNPVVLVGDAGGATNPSYLWAPGGQTTSTISVTTPGNYVLTVTNSCGSSIASEGVTAGTSPSLNSFTCSTASDVGTVTVNANDPNALGLTYSWFENGNPISNGGDFTITNGATTSTLEVANVASNHQGSVFTCEVANDCGKFTTPGCVTLPVELIYFTGAIGDEGVLLKWATASETGSEAFVVERSYDGRSFEAIGERAAAGNSFEELNYDFLDRDFNTSAEQMYYRLRQVDIDGTISNSQVVAVRTDAESQFQLESIFAAGNNLSIQFFTPDTKDFTATIYNLNGQALQTFRFDGYEGFNRQDLTTITLPEGFYILQLSDGFRTAVQKFVR